ncbi:hypothetical protein SRHO_G00060220 [Serrasalmus rhombeus]
MKISETALLGRFQAVLFTSDVSSLSVGRGRRSALRMRSVRAVPEYKVFCKHWHFSPCKEKSLLSQFLSVFNKREPPCRLIWRERWKPSLQCSTVTRGKRATATH